MSPSTLEPDLDLIHSSMNAYYQRAQRSTSRALDYSSVCIGELLLDAFHGNMTGTATSRGVFHRGMVCTQDPTVASLIGTTHCLAPSPDLMKLSLLKDTNHPY
ncbi:hypothetical protein CHUAL_004426 [Chamberlinius hualienensis]